MAYSEMIHEGVKRIRHFHGKLHQPELVSLRLLCRYGRFPVRVPHEDGLVVCGNELIVEYTDLSDLCCNMFDSRAMRLFGFYNLPGNAVFRRGQLIGHGLSQQELNDKLQPYLTR